MFLFGVFVIRKSLVAITVLSAFLGAGNLARAATMYDMSLAAPGFYNGTGGVNNGFTVTNNGGIDVALRAMLRQNPADIANGSNNIYSVPLGSQTNITSGGNGANPARAAWNFDFSVDLLSSGLHLSDISTVLTITGVPGSPPGSPISFDALTAFSDNSGWDTAKNVALSNLGTDTGFQNSENALFVGINSSLDATYNFQLDVYNGPIGNRTLIASDSIVVVAGSGGVSTVPLPTSASMGIVTLAGLAVCAFLRRRAITA